MVTCWKGGEVGVLGEILVGGVLLFGARVGDVSLGTLRTLLLVRGNRLVAAGIGFFEVLIYVFALNFVFRHLDTPINLVFYGLGFAAGNLVGAWLEERLAFGYATVQVITLQQPEKLAADLRREGFGVTTVQGEGLEGKHLILYAITKRRLLHMLLGRIRAWDAQAFITVLETRTTRGGFYGRHGK